MLGEITADVVFWACVGVFAVLGYLGMIILGRYYVVSYVFAMPLLVTVALSLTLGYAYAHGQRPVAFIWLTRLNLLSHLIALCFFILVTGLVGRTHTKTGRLIDDIRGGS